MQRALSHNIETFTDLFITDFVNEISLKRRQSIHRGVSAFVVFLARYDLAVRSQTRQNVSHREGGVNFIVLTSKYQNGSEIRPSIPLKLTN